MHARIAKALGWPMKNVESMSMQALRELVRTVDPSLADEMSQAIRSGSYIKGPRLVDMNWLGEPPPLKCGACARIGTNDTRPMAHSPSCPKGR